MKNKAKSRTTYLCLVELRCFRERERERGAELWNTDSCEINKKSKKDWKGEVRMGAGWEGVGVGGGGGPTMEKEEGF